MISASGWFKIEKKTICPTDYKLQNLASMCKNHHLPYEKNVHTIQAGLWLFDCSTQIWGVMVCGRPSLENLVLASVSANSHKSRPLTLFFPLLGE